MTPTKFDGMDGVLGAPDGWDGDMHGPCAGLPVMRRDGICISRWRLTWRERLGILFGRAVYCHVASGETQPPVALNVETRGLA